MIKRLKKLFNRKKENPTQEAQLEKTPEQIKAENAKSFSRFCRSMS